MPDEIKIDPKNARKHPDRNKDAIRVSLEKLGAGRSVVVDNDNVLIAGNGVWEQAEALGIKTRVIETDGTELVVVKRTDLSGDDDKRAALAVADNKIGELAEWDDDLLAELIGGIDEDLQWLTGFDDDELAAMFHDGEEEKDDVPEPPAEARAKRGQIFTLGQHRIMCGDATEGEDVSRLLDGNEPNLMVTDPPYGVNYDPKWREKYDQFERHSDDPVTNDDRADWSEAWQLFPGNIVYTWSPARGLLVTTGAILEQCGFEIKQQLIWVKQHFVFGRGMYHMRHEPCWYAIRKGATADWNADRKQDTVWEIKNSNPMGGDDRSEKTKHSTEKPLECMARPIRNHKGDVYDPFLGSGTTLIAAEQLKRICYGMEIEPRYIDVTIQRWCNLTEADQGEVYDNAGRA